MDETTIEVRVVMIPGQSKTVVIPAESTVADALQAAGVNLANPESPEGVRWNGEVIDDLAHPVGDNDRVVVAKDAVGN